MSIKSPFKDWFSAFKMLSLRSKKEKNAPTTELKMSNINKVAYSLHPGKIELIVDEIRSSSLSSKTFKFISNSHIPYFEAGTYLTLDFVIGESCVTRAYSISSSPSDTLLDQPFIEITVKKCNDGFISDYLLNEVKVGDKFKSNIGIGNFHLDNIRDSKNIIAICGGSGITPFVSIAKEIDNAKLNFNLTILYGSVSQDDIVLKDELDKLESDKVKVIHVLSGENPNWNGEKGFINSDIIKKYSYSDSTYFICGPQVMYNFIEKELNKLNIDKRKIHFEIPGQIKDITSDKNYPIDKRDNEYTITIYRGIDKTIIKAKANESILTSLERKGIKINSACRSGVCGMCRVKLLSGNVFITTSRDKRRYMDKEYNFIYACSSYPISDIEIKIPIIE